MFSYSNKQDRKKQPTKLSVSFSPLMYCLNTILTIDSFLCVSYKQEPSSCIMRLYLRTILACYQGSHNRTVCLFNLTNIKVVRSLSIKASGEHQNDGVGTF